MQMVHVPCVFLNAFMSYEQIENLNWLNHLQKASYDITTYQTWTMLPHPKHTYDIYT